MVTDKFKIEQATAILGAGRLVAFPTDTVFALAAAAWNDNAVARIFAAKGRSGDKPLPILVADTEAAADIAEFGVAARRLSEAFWPGRLTLVLPLNSGSGLASAVTCGLGTVAIRVPGHPMALCLLQSFGGPLAVTSANRSGDPSACSVEEVAASLGEAVDMILDGPPAPAGIDSVIVAVDEDSLSLLRPGDIPIEEIAKVAGLPIRDHEEPQK